MDDFQLVDHFHGAICGLGFCGREPGEDSAGCVLSVESVRFTDQAPHSLIGPVHLDDTVSVTEDE